jgi:DNA-binding transcriptional regulator YdaS (Cro superfamily)
MKLIDYYKEHFRTQGEFAEFLGVDQSLVSRWFNGERTPSKRDALVIALKTKGAVSVQEAITNS